MIWDDGLTGNAYEIAASDNTPIRVVAGPGTGKTFALKKRIARLLENGVDPESILVVTFSRTAASDLENEIESINIPGVQNLHIGTLHSICLSILNKSAVIRIIGRNSRILFDFEKRFLLEDLGEMAIPDCDETFYARKKRLHAFEAAWAREQDQEPGWPSSNCDKHFQTILNEWLIFHQAMLVDEFIPLTLRYLRDNPGSIELRRYQYVLVDEYQDLNKGEQHLIDFLATNAKLLIVGDEDQSIYESFRYAHPEGISRFHLLHPTTKDIPLIECRRCPKSVVSIANNLISNNIRRCQHSLEPFIGNAQGEIHIVQWNDLQNEVDGLAEYINHQISNGYFDPSKTIILSPRKYIGYRIRDALRQKGCSAYSFFLEELVEGNPKRLDESLAQQRFTLLNLLVNPQDSVSLRLWLGFGSSNLRVKEYCRLRDYCGISNLTTWEALEMIVNGELHLPLVTNSVNRYLILKEELEKLNKLSTQEVFDSLFPEGEIWAEPFRQIIETTENEINSTADILRRLQLNLYQPEIPQNGDYVRIMSLYKSKGLNADHVIVMGCIEGILPQHPDSNISFEEQRRFAEEQRRLFYVAITRAKKTLVLSSVLQLPRNLAHRMRATIVGGNRDNANTITSTFIAEFGNDAPKPVRGKEWLERQLSY